MSHVDVGNPARTAPDEPSLSPDLAFELLADERRRALVAALLDADHEVAVAELADALAVADETSVATQLHHVHLPKLEAAGVIEWNEREYVEPTPLLATLEPLLRAVQSVE